MTDSPLIPPRPEPVEPVTARPAWSDRWSGRVEGDPAESPGLRAADADTGHGSVTTPHASPVAAERRRPRQGRSQLLAVSDSLSERDRAILADLAKFRFLTTGQLQTLHFHDHLTPDGAARICRRVLDRLQRARVIEHLDRRIGGVRAGSRSYIWRVGAIGDRLLRLAADGPRARRHEPSLRFLDHSLAVADAVTALTVAARRGRFELLRADTEPATWRSYLAGSGSREVLKPDLYVVAASGDFEDHYFIEVDRGTESIATVLGQCHQYEAYRRTGQLQQAIEVFPYVVWVVPDVARAERLATAITHARRLDVAHYRVVIQTELARLITDGADS